MGNKLLNIGADVIFTHQNTQQTMPCTGFQNLLYRAVKISSMGQHCVSANNQLSSAKFCSKFDGKCNAFINGAPPLGISWQTIVLEHLAQFHFLQLSGRRMRQLFNKYDIIRTPPFDHLTV